MSRRKHQNMVRSVLILINSSSLSTKTKSNKNRFPCDSNYYQVLGIHVFVAEYVFDEANQTKRKRSYKSTENQVSKQVHTYIEAANMRMKELKARLTQKGNVIAE